MMLPRSIFPVVLLLSLLAVAGVQAELSLGELRAKFELAIEEEETAHAEKSKKLREGYIGALERLKGTLGREGKLDSATQVLAELEVLQENKGVGPLPDNADFRFKRLRNTWEDAQRKLDEARLEKVSEVARVYLKLLADRKDDLTRAGEIRRALVVDEELKRVKEMGTVREAMAGRVGQAKLEGKYGQGNLALAENGARSDAEIDPACMIDGKVKDYFANGTYSKGVGECTFKVELAELYVISQIRLLTWDHESRRYRFQLEVSPDGETWTLVDDQSEKGARAGWYKVDFAPRDTRFIKLKGLGNTVNNGFHLVELEAYSPAE